MNLSKWVNYIAMSLILMILVQTNTVYGSAVTDSLYNRLKTLKDDFLKVQTLNSLAFEYRNNEPDTAIYFSDLSIKLSEQINDQTGLADAKLNRSSALVNTAKYEEALQNVSSAIDIYDEILTQANVKNKMEVLKQKARACSVRGNIYYYQGNYKEANRNYFTSLKIREEADDKAGVASSYNNIASIYLEQGNYPEALRMNFNALKIREELQDKIGLVASYNNIGNVYEALKNYNESLKMHMNALKLRKEISDDRGIAQSYNNIGGIYAAKGKYEEALESHKAALEIRLRMDDMEGVATSYTNIGNVLIIKNMLPDALASFQSALQIGSEIGDPGNIAFATIKIGEIYMLQGNYSEASGYLYRGVDLIKELDNKNYILLAYQQLAKLDSLKGDYRNSLMHYQLYIAYRDSLFNEDNTKRTVQAEMQYDFDKRESLRKAEQDKKEALMNAEIRRQRIIKYFTITVLCMILILGAYIFYNFRKRKKLEGLQALSNERLRISRELHDDIGSTLGSIAVYSDVAKNRSMKNENPAEVLSKIGLASRELIEKMSDIVWSLNPDNESFEQLQNRMQSFAAMILTSRNISFQFTVDDSLKSKLFSNEQRKNIFLIFKEAIHNCVKYAHCSNVMISIRELKDKVILTVKDDGKGFDVSAVSDTKSDVYNGNGLRNMQTRATEVNGLLQVNAKVNAGTEIVFSFPC